MNAHRPSAAEPWPGWTTSHAAQAAYGEHLVHVAARIPQQLHRFITDRHALSAAYASGQPEGPAAEAGLVELEYRDDLLDTGAALDVLALCHPPGRYEPRPYSEDEYQPEDPVEELRTDAAEVADLLVRHDHRHNTSRTGSIPPALPDEGASGEQRDAARAYLRAEWLAAEKSHRSA